MKKKEYKPLAKNRKNTSGRASKAKRDGLAQAKAAKDRLSGKQGDGSKSNGQRIAKGIPYKRQPLKASGSPKPLPDDLMVDKRGLKLRQLLRLTPRLFHNNAQYVRMLSVKKAKTTSGLTAYLGVMRTHDPGRDKPPRKRNVSIIGLDPDSGLPVNKQRVLLQCDCENYAFTWEYANTAHNAARLLFSNGQYPGFTNPKLAPGMCKHLVAFAHMLILDNR
jgi:hypothetical protein